MACKIIGFKSYSYTAATTKYIREPMRVIHQMFAINSTTVYS